MSKTSKTGLTPSRKTRRTRFDWVAWLDKMDDHYHAITTLTGLLEICSEPIEPELARHTGGLIDREAQALKKLLAAVQKEMVR